MLSTNYPDSTEASMAKRIVTIKLNSLFPGLKALFKECVTIGRFVQQDVGIHRERNTAMS